MDFSWLTDIRDTALQFFGFEERPAYEPGYTVPVGGVEGMEKYLPWIMVGFLGVILVVSMRK